jgi:hypothetical protein
MPKFDFPLPNADLFKVADQAGLKRPIERFMDDYPIDEIYRGTLVEIEHTKHWQIAAVIAAHHLDEFPDYYGRLEAMERAAKEYWGRKRRTPI